TSKENKALGYKQSRSRCVFAGARDQMFLFVDNHKQNGIGTVDNTIECVYTGTQAVGYTSRQDCQDNYNFNTEHVFPQSIFNEDPPMVADMHHLFPVTSGANSQRSNDPFGVVSNPSWTSGGSKSNGNTFEPRDEHKGAIARSLFYFVLRYQDFQNFVAPQEAVLRTWLLAHLPDSVEWNRNDDIYALQNNRNPFIDHPEFIERISSITGTASASPAPALHHVADTMAFASVVPGNDRDGQLVLSNQGDQDLTLSSFNFSDAAFTLLGSPSLTVPADSERVLTIRFSPTTASTDYSSTLTFSTNDPGNASVTVDLLGDTYPVSATAPDESEALFVYPVPATDLLMLRTSGQHDFHTAELIAADGRILRTQPLDSGHQQFGMNIATVRSGIYLLRVSGTEGRLVKKVWIK
ncbi:MAG: endonuclease, partial [Bacteroidota bacterium]